MTARKTALAPIAAMLFASVAAAGNAYAADEHGAPTRHAAPAGHHASGGHGWSYEGESGPEKWGELSRDYSLCKTGRMQSPIDLGASDLEGKLSVSAAYKPGPLTILNNGHTVQVNFPAGSTLTSGISRYKLVQVHFHTPSEETIYGLHYPMVAHFVHSDHAGNLAVLAVLFEEGAPNRELDKLIKAAPAHAAEPNTHLNTTFDPGKLLPENLAVYRFEGSLTTPPCSEGVRWHVATHPVSASASQITALHAILGDNARPTQPRHGRLVVAGTN